MVPVAGVMVVVMRAPLEYDISVAFHVKDRTTGKYEGTVP